MPLHALAPYFTRSACRLITETFPAGSFKSLFTWATSKLGQIVDDSACFTVFGWKLFPFREILRHAPESSENNWKLLFLMTKRFSPCEMHNRVPLESFLQLHVQGRQCSRIVVIIRSVVISRFYRSSDNRHRHDFFLGAITRRSSTQMNDSDAWWCNNGFLFTPGARKLVFDMRSQVENWDKREIAC